MNQDETDDGDHAKPLDPTKPLVEHTVNWRSVATFFGILGIMLVVVVVAFLLSLSPIRESANRMSSTSHLKQIGLAFHNYEASFGSFPTNSYAPDGTPLLSWRVHLLPFIEQDALYKQFHLDEPWDSPYNRRLLPLMPSTYHNPREEVLSGFTYYRSFGHTGAIMEPRFATRVTPQGNVPLGVTLAECMSGLSETIFVIEAGTPVEWTKPDDLDASTTLPPLAGQSRKGYAVQFLLGDGSVSSRTHPLNGEQLQTQTLYAEAATAKVP